MFVYLINKFETNQYKIGATRRTVIERLKELQTGSADKLLIIDSFKSKYPFLLENSLQQRFRTNSFRENSEWFELEKEQILKFQTICEKLEEGLNALKSGNHFFMNRS